MPKSKRDLIEAVADRRGIGTREAEASIDTVLAAIASLAADDRLTLRGFGSFETRTRAARQGRNPQTGEAIQIPASTVLAFRAAK